MVVQTYLFMTLATSIVHRRRCASTNFSSTIVSPGGVYLRVPVPDRSPHKEASKVPSAD